MLLEVLEYALTPCPPWARRLGLLHQAVSLRARYRRQRAAWGPHVAACRQFIVAAAARAAPGGRAVVLGSGQFIELPLAELAGRFREVVLVDAIHGWPERWQLRRFTGVNRVEADLTGVLARLDGPELPTPAFPLAGERFDFAVSANLMSQLTLFPLSHLEGRIAAEPLEAFARSLVEAHLSGFKALAPVACLITDIERLALDAGRLLEREDILHGLALPPPDGEWLWDIAPRPEDAPHHDLRHRVGGWVFTRGPAFGDMV